jgi:hypothetical protein
MKHLKGFNESVTKEDLQELCETSLAYLMDEGFDTTILGSDQKMIFLTKNGGTIFYWDQVKDYYISFLQLINRRYEIVGQTVHIQFIDWKYYSYDEIVNETVEIPDNRILSIRILIKEKK